MPRNIQRSDARDKKGVRLRTSKLTNGQMLWCEEDLLELHHMWVQQSACSRVSCQRRSFGGEQLLLHMPMFGSERTLTVVQQFALHIFVDAGSSTWNELDSNL